MHLMRNAALIHICLHEANLQAVELKYVIICEQRLKVGDESFMDM